MSRRNPFDEIAELFERMSQTDRSGWDDVGGVSVDVRETDADVVVTADLPGYDREDIDVAVKERTLTIEAEREEEHSEEGERYHRQERSHRRVSRSLRLPVEVDEQGADATYRNGVLTVTLPQRDADAGDSHTIDVE
jgi:HSP20 family protein